MSRARLALLVAAAAGSLVAAPAMASAVPAPPPPCPRVVSIADYRANEGTAPIGVPTFFRFTITSTGCANAGTIEFETYRVTAAHSDYTRAEGFIEFTAGDMSPRTITVLVAADPTVEREEEFVVGICRPTPSNRIWTSRAEATGYIVNDDENGDVEAAGNPPHEFRCSR